MIRKGRFCPADMDVLVSRRHNSSNILPNWGRWKKLLLHHVGAKGRKEFNTEGEVTKSKHIHKRTKHCKI